MKRSETKSIIHGFHVYKVLNLWLIMPLYFQAFQKVHKTNLFTQVCPKVSNSIV